MRWYFYFLKITIYVFFKNKYIYNSFNFVNFTIESKIDSISTDSKDNFLFIFDKNKNKKKINKKKY